MNSIKVELKLWFYVFKKNGYFKHQQVCDLESKIKKYVKLICINLTKFELYLHIYIN